MKRCPTCGSTYTDNTLVYCLQDGATLQGESEATNPLNLAATLRHDVQAHDASAPPTEIMNFASVPTAEMQAGALPTSPYQEPHPTAHSTQDDALYAKPQPRSATRTIALTAIGTIVLLIVGFVGVWLFLRGGARTNRNAVRGAGQANANGASSVPPAQTPGAANSANASAASKTNNAKGGDRADKGGRWFVILGSFPKDETGNANERLELVRRQGFDARMLASDDYPNMKSGLWMIVMGPYTRNNAEEILKQVRPTITDAYTKSGW